MKGYVVTNNHVKVDTSVIKYTAKDGRKLMLGVVGKSIRRSDIALIQIRIRRT